MVRYIRRDKVGMFGGRGGGDDGGNDNKVRGSILRIPYPLRVFIASLFVIMKGLEFNLNQNWNRSSRRNTKRRTRSTGTGNHPRRRTRISSMRRGKRGSLLQEGGR